MLDSRGPIEYNGIVIESAQLFRRLGFLSVPGSAGLPGRKKQRRHERKDRMSRFIPREKLSRKARKLLDQERRATWAFPPVTRKVESKKLYSRKKKSHDRYDDYGMGFPFAS